MYWCVFLIDLISQSAVALYIYRVGGLVPQEILLQDLNLWKYLVVLGLCSDRSDRSDRSVSCRAGYSILPVWPLGQTDQTGRCQFWLSTQCRRRKDRRRWVGRQQGTGWWKSRHFCRVSSHLNPNFNPNPNLICTSRSPSNPREILTWTHLFMIITPLRGSRLHTVVPFQQWLTSLNGLR